MNMSHFENHDLSAVGEALDIAEDVTGDFFKFSATQWKRHLYEVRTLTSLRRDEITEHAFALLNRGAAIIEEFDSQKREKDIYSICLQDHQILKALGRDEALELLPLLVYVFTHELIHIVRFGNFSQRFEVSCRDRDKEERVVHSATFEALGKLSLPKLYYVLDSYRGHRICDTAFIQ